ncbi:Aste57867_24523 [Aphanomyces stellatus]|uniref:Aste57867_24523 protein n=1 Tax=Aphanomyces stellatus TaxID=120398 RepID=A0A485LQK6_9STRA|nr:hypothetical protein As57867_024446 [Aphanomyces stellatus]VFU01162.1 Aste57867_24523 [Aphanomyces stellatus]
MASNDERYAQVMGNLFPEFQNKPKTLDITRWHVGRSIAHDDEDGDARHEDGGRRAVNPIFEKPVVMYNSKSSHHPSRNHDSNDVPAYNQKLNPSPLSASTRGYAAAANLPLSKKLSRRLTLASREHPNLNTKPPSAKSSFDSSLPPAAVSVVFNNQLPSDDLHIFYTKLGGRTIMDFLVHPGREVARHVLGKPTPSPSGIHVVCFPFTPLAMLEPSFVFPVAASHVQTTPVTMTFAVNHSTAVYDLFYLDTRGGLVSLGTLDNVVVTHHTFANHPFVVWCRGSTRGVCVSVDEGAAQAKVRYSLVVDDTVPSVSFMAQPHLDDTTTLCLSFFPR